MFGLKWLWKSNKSGSSIDTSNFVSKEFFSTTLQDYVNRDLFNTTLSDYITTTSLNNTLSTFASKEYVSNELTNYMNRTEIGINLVQYVKKTSLTQTLADYVQTSSLNTTLANYLTTNTEQTITGLKTFRATPVAFKIQQAAGRDDKQYIIFANKDNTTTFSLGSDLSGTNLELNRGHLRIQAKEANKNVYFDNVAYVEFNNAVPQFGQNITAGWGGGVCKFIPEDNSTKTLQFYLNNANDTRRFNLKVAEPTEANNPTTKNYVDTQVNTLNQRITTSNNTIQNNYATREYVDNLVNSNTNMGLNLKYQDLDLSSLQKDIDTDLNTFTRVQFTISTLQNVKLLSISINYTDQDVLPLIKKWVFNYAEGNNSKIYCSLFNAYTPLNPQPVLTKSFIRIFYIDLTGARVENPYFIERGK